MVSDRGFFFFFESPLYNVGSCFLLFQLTYGTSFGLYHFFLCPYLPVYGTDFAFACNDRINYKFDLVLPD